MIFRRYVQLFRFKKEFNLIWKEIRWRRRRRRCPWTKFTSRNVNDLQRWRSRWRQRGWRFEFRTGFFHTNCHSSKSICGLSWLDIWKNRTMCSLWSYFLLTFQRMMTNLRINSLISVRSRDEHIRHRHHRQQPLWSKMILPMTKNNSYVTHSFRCRWWLFWTFQTIKLRRALTDLLLAVTNEELALLAKEVYIDCKGKRSVPSTPESHLTHVCFQRNPLHLSFAKLLDWRA